MKNGTQDVYDLKFFLLMFLVINLSSAFTFKCPSPYQWNLRAESRCLTADRYICLFDENENIYKEICRNKAYCDPAGFKLVISGNLDRRECVSSRFQPFRFSTNEESVCMFKKTYCSDEGQIIFDNGSTESDRQCRCDYTRGYDFITKPEHGCYCVPSMEDCSCYQKPCPRGSIVSPDYQCINLTSWNSQFTCDLILPFMSKDTTYPSNDNNLDDNKAAPERNMRFILSMVIGVTIVVIIIIVQITWFCLPKIESFKDANKSVLRENVELRSILTGKVIPQNIRDLQQHVKKQWKERFSHFVETRASNAIIERITKEQCFIISGPFGCGKSSLAFHIALKLETLEYDFMIISNPDDLLRYASEDKKQVFLIDDVFGKYSVSEYDTMWWNRQGESILHLVNRNPNLRLLMTSRLHIYRSVNLEQLKERLYLLNLIFKDVALSFEERKMIGKCYLQEDVIDNLGKETVMLYSFFPMLCRNINNTANENIFEYFKNPVECIKIDIENMKNSQDLFYLALAVLVICDNNVNKNIFNQANHEYDEMLKFVSKEIGYDRKPSKQLLFLRLIAVIDSYVSETESYFECLHVKMFNALAFCIGPSIIRSILRYGTSSFIIDKMQLETLGGQVPKLTIMIPNSLQEMYFERMLLDMKTGLHNIFIGNQHVSEGSRASYIVYMKKHLKKGDLKTETYATTVLHHVAEKGYNDYVGFFLNQDIKLLNLPDILGQTALHKACMKGHLNVIKLLLNKNAKTDLSDYEGKTALDIACSGELIDTAELLLSKKSSILLKKYDLQSALHVACMNNHLKIAELLLKHKAKVNATDKHGHTPLNLACKEGHLGIVELLVKYQLDVNISSNNGRTALYYAVERNNINIVRSLLKSSANPNKVIEKGKVPLHCASIHGSLEIARLLIEHKATVDIDDIKGCTPLYFACKNGHVKVAELLLHNKANANKLNCFLTSPTFIACQNNHIDIVKLLLEHKAIVNCKNLALLTPLHVACLNNHKDMISLLIKHGAFVNEHEKTDQTPFHYAQLEGYQIVTAFMSVPIKNDQTPLHIACKIGDEKTVKILLDAGANVNDANPDGITPLHMACKDGNERNGNGVSDAGHCVDGDDNDGNEAFNMNIKAGKENIVKLLLENDAKCDAGDKNGISPLHVACEEGKREILQLLLDAGDNVNKSDNNGITPLHLACKCGKTEIVAFLLNAGADVNKRDKDDITPMDIACKEEKQSIEELLLAKSKPL